MSVNRFFRHGFHGIRSRKLTFPAILLAAGLAAADEAPRQEIIINGFRQPSMGLEYRYLAVSFHVGIYPTIISKNSRGDNETTWFSKVGATVYFLPFSIAGQRPSSFFLSGSYLRGLNNDWKNAFFSDLGFRWIVWRGLDLRLGTGVLLSPDHEIKINPTPGIGYGIPL